MKLVIGGCAQGKLSYVLKNSAVGADRVFEGEIPEDTEKAGTIIIDQFHQWVKRRLLQNGCPEREIFDFIKEHPDCVIISDEIGNGIIPMEAFEREYRERTGRILVELAKKAEAVERVICGIGQKIK